MSLYLGQFGTEEKRLQAPGKETNAQFLSLDIQGRHSAITSL